MHDTPRTMMAHETEIDGHGTIVDWCNFLDGEKFRQNRGTADNGKARVVETDESKYFHRKYHRQQWREGHWVFGGIERRMGKCFLVEVPDRTAAATHSRLHSTWQIHRFRWLAGIC